MSKDNLDKSTKKIQAKSDKKADKKALLNLRINEIGEDRILYPHTNAKRHPYTQEIMLMADAQGYIQKQIAELCGVSQPAVSQWENGENLATLEQLENLIPKLTPMAPGKGFHKLKVVKRTYKQLVEGWETDMIAEAIQPALTALRPALSEWVNLNEIMEGELGSPIHRAMEDLEYYDYKVSIPQIDGSGVEEALCGTVRAGQVKELQAFDEAHQIKLDNLESQLGKLKELHEHQRAEEMENADKREQWQDERKLYLAVREELRELSTDKLESLLERDCPEPIACHSVENALLSHLEGLSNHFHRKNEIEDVVKGIEEQLKSSKEEYVLERVVLLEHQSIVLESENILNKYNRDVFVEGFDIEDAFSSSTTEFDRIGCELYGETEYKLQVPLTVTLSGRYQQDFELPLKPQEVNVNMACSFESYVSTLKHQHEFEFIQVCGEEVLSATTLESNREWGVDPSNNDEKVICYQLFNNSLFLVHTFFDPQDNNVELNYIYQLHTADELISKVKNLIESHNWERSNFCDDWTNCLVKLGYRFNHIRSIY